MDDEWRDPEPVDWAKVRSGIDNGAISEDLEQVLQKQVAVRRALRDQPANERLVQLAAQLSDENILNALRNRQALERERAELREILKDAGGKTPREHACAWRQLWAWIRRYERTGPGGQRQIDVSDLVMARRLYGRKTPPPPRLHALEAFRDLTDRLGNAARSAGPPLNVVHFHELSHVIEQLLAGHGAEAHPLITQVEAQVREILAAPPAPVARDDQQDLDPEAVDDAPEDDPFRESLIRTHVNTPIGRAILKTLMRATGPVATAALKEAADAARDESDLAIGRLRDGVEQAHRGRTTETILRVMRDSCQRCIGSTQCSDHLGFVRTPTRGKNVLTDAGREHAAQLMQQQP